MTALTTCLGLPLMCLFTAPETAPKPGDLVFETGFETAAERDAWSKHATATWETSPAGTVLKVVVPAERAADGNMIQLPIDLTPYRGCSLALECRAKAAGVTQQPQSYLGVKYMLHYASEASGAYWGNQNDVHGTFDWKPLRFVAPIADDAGRGDLNLGLQNCSGTVWFDDLTITVAKGPMPKRPTPPLNPPPAYKGHQLPRLRGVMSPNVYRDEDLRVLGQEWNANLIRWQITRNWGRAGTDQELAEYDTWFSGKLDELDQALVACRKYGLLAVIDVHSPPGGRLEGNELRIFHEQKYQAHWLQWWEKIARRYRGNPAVWGYDLINEPVQNAVPAEPGVLDYLAAQEKVAKAIRAIDPDTPIIIEANQWDSSAGYRELMPIDVPNVIYQVHMYNPGEFTHQGVHGSKVGVAYPGVIGGVEWNKDRIRSSLAPVREFQLAYNVHIYCGEFSAIRWAQGAAQYLSDCIEVFEEYGWDWTYHAYREWDGWSLEHGPDQNDAKPTAEPSDRKQVVLGWFAKNQKP